MIKSFTNNSEWASAEKPTTESTIGLLLDSNTPVLAGNNIIVKYPKYGDAVVLDADGNIKFIAFGTFNNSTFPENWTKVGVVYHTFGKEAWVVALSSLEAKKYSNIWRLKITDYVLDGADHTVTLKTYDNNGTATSLSWTYNASTKSGFINQFNTWVSNNNDPNNRDYYMYLDSNEDVQFVEGNYTTYRQHSDTFTDLTTTITVASELPALSTTYDLDGIARGYNIVNPDAIKRWGGRTLSSADAITSNNTPISQSSFNGNLGVNYQTQYETYDNYLKHVQVQIPTNKGAASLRNKGWEYTYALSEKTYINKQGESVIMYPACNSVANFGFSNNSLVSAGNWYIPDIEEGVTLLRPITLGNTGVTADMYDKVNKTLSAMGNYSISTNDNRWVSVRCDSNSMWGYISYGYLSINNFSKMYGVLPVCRLFIA